MESTSQVADPLQMFWDTVALVEKSEQAIVSEKKKEFELQVTATQNVFIGKLIEDYVSPENRNELIERLIAEAEKYVTPENRPEFRLRLTLDLTEYILELMNTTLSSVNGGGGTKELQERWRELRARGEVSKRRRELLHPSSADGFEATLRWMAERGVEFDLIQLRKLRDNPPYTSEEIERLFEIAEKRITERLENSQNAERALPQREIPVTTNVQDLGWATFKRELPRLLRDAPGKWVAFHGNRQAALASSKSDVYERLLKMKCPLEEVVVRRIKPLGQPVNLQRIRRA